MKSWLMAVAVVAWVSPANAQCGSRGVYIFGAYWCPACRAVEGFLGNNNISYERIEVTGKPDVHRFMQAKFGTNSIPVVVIDHDYVVGFDIAWIRNALCIR